MIARLSRITLTLVGLFGASTFAADWPAFRGPQFNGISAETSAVTNWDSSKHVKWKTALPRPGNGSPIIMAGKVFVTSAEDDEGKHRSLYCYEAKSGEKLWVRTVSFDRVMPTHQTNPYCATTPASDGQRVVVWHATAGLYCYDLNGNPLWQRDLGNFEHMWGYGTSPIFVDGRIALYTGPSKSRSFVTVLDPQSGQTVWEVAEPFDGDGNYNSNKKYMGSWSTPVVDRSTGTPRLIVMQPTRVNAYDLATGEIVWYCRELNHDQGDLAYSSPVLGDGICFVTGGFRGPSMAIRLAGKGDVTESQRVWRTEKNPQSIGSGVYVKGHVFRPNTNPGSLECINLNTGKTTWKERATDAGFWGSVVKIGNHLHAVDQQGTTVVFKPNTEKLEVIARNELGEPCNSSLAVANGRLFIRTAKHLFAIGAQ